MKHPPLIKRISSEGIRIGSRGFEGNPESCLCPLRAGSPPLSSPLTQGTHRPPQCHQSQFQKPTEHEGSLGKSAESGPGLYLLGEAATANILGQQEWHSILPVLPQHSAYRGMFHTTLTARPCFNPKSKRWLRKLPLECLASPAAPWDISCPCCVFDGGCKEVDRSPVGKQWYQDTG